MSVHVTSWVWKQTIGDPEAKLILLKLADQANDDGECWPSRRTIASSCETSMSTVTRSIRYLTDRGYLSVTVRARPDGSQSSNLYCFPKYLNTPSHSEQGGGPSDQGGGSPTDQGGGQRDQGAWSEGPGMNQVLEPVSEASLNQARDFHSLEDEMNQIDAKTQLSQYDRWELERDVRAKELDEEQTLALKAENKKGLAAMRESLGL